MVRFCGNCGAQLEENARVCGQCGTPIEGSGGRIPNFEVDAPVKKGKGVKLVKVVAILAVLVIIAVVGTRIVLNFTGANGLVRKVMAAYKDYDIETLVDISSDMYYDTDNVDDVEEYFEDVVGEAIDVFESSVGHSYKFSYEVEEIYDLSQRRQDEMMEDLEDACPGFDIDIISKITVAEIKVKVKQENKSSSRSVIITMSKENGSWRLLYLE